MAIEHVFFDLDHTLWDFETNSAKAYEMCFIENNIDIDIKEFLGKYIAINFNYWKLYREEKVTREELQYGRLKDAFKAINYTISDLVIDKIAIEYLGHLPEFNTLFEGAIEVLEYLKAKYKLHIITNGFAEIQHHKIKKSGMQAYFTELITSESVGVKKPNPKVFHYALKKANALASDSVMIGDSLEADIQGAIRVGMKAIHFNPESKIFPVHHKHEIKHLYEIKKYL